jgi:hypothetical protein
MPDVLTELQSQLTQLQKARTSGMSVISYATNGVQRSLTFKSDKELLAAIQDLERRIAELQYGSQRIVHVASSKGLQYTDEG